jgi:hypothetical protein
MRLASNKRTKLHSAIERIVRPLWMIALPTCPSLPAALPLEQHRSSPRHCMCAQPGIRGVGGPGDSTILQHAFLLGQTAAAILNCRATISCCTKCSPQHIEHFISFTPPRPLARAHLTSCACRTPRHPWPASNGKSALTLASQTCS